MEFVVVLVLVAAAILVVDDRGAPRSHKATHGIERRIVFFLLSVYLSLPLSLPIDLDISIS